ncbi:MULTISPECIES: hypothetical protein [unclassified Kribbella]|uniref:hypothetical protein n=1 Tax=unclassified Kribbella TaxID=2644121 RepID=UPI0033F986FE|nr:hypothetical protein OG817_27625 [Kribbella sp. NBC_00889]
MNQLLDRVRQFWLSRHPRTRALAVLAPFIAQYHAMTGHDLTNRVLGDSVILGLAAMYGALPRAAEQSAERWLAECAVAVDRASNTHWQLNQHANDLLPEVSEAIWRRLHYLDPGTRRG